MKLRSVLLVIPLLAGCAAPNSIVTTGQSVLGLSVSENPATQLYEARVGLVVSQIAFVPCSTNGTGFVPSVIQEFRMNNLLAGGMLYQRLAIGTDAVNQPGASLMFAKDSKGNLSTNLLSEAVQRLQAPRPK